MNITTNVWKKEDETWDGQLGNFKLAVGQQRDSRSTLSEIRRAADIWGNCVLGT